MLNKQICFNPYVIIFKINNTELTTILLAYIPSIVMTFLIIPFSCVISRTSLQRNTIKLLEVNKRIYMHIRSYKTEYYQWVVSGLGFFSSDVVGCVTTLEIPFIHPSLSFLTSLVLASSPVAHSSAQPVYSFSYFPGEIFERRF